MDSETTQVPKDYETLVDLVSQEAQMFITLHGRKKRDACVNFSLILDDFYPTQIDDAEKCILREFTEKVVDLQFAYKKDVAKEYTLSKEQKKVMVIQGTGAGCVGSLLGFGICGAIGLMESYESMWLSVPMVSAICGLATVVALKPLQRFLSKREQKLITKQYHKNLFDLEQDALEQLTLYQQNFEIYRANEISMPYVYIH